MSFSLRPGQRAARYVGRVDRTDNTKFIEALSQSQIYQDYERAFSKTTGLPLSLRPVEDWQRTH